jgi:hypothetical protein
MLNVNMLSIVMLGVILQSMLGFILLSIVVLSVILLCIAKPHYTEGVEIELHALTPMQENNSLEVQEMSNLIKS